MLPATLHPLREDLQLHAGAHLPDGSPSWLIQDPIANTFYRIGWLEFELLARWFLADPAAILAATAAETPLAPRAEEFAAFYGFLLDAQLLSIHDPALTGRLVARHRTNTLSRAKWLLHHYLFIRIPLLHPAAFLRRLLRWTDWLYSAPALACLLGLTLLGLALTARQWDLFAASVTETLSPGGLAGYLAALAVAKSVHELGHALTATRHGLRVAHMGVALVVMWPMLYTDTSEAWRLADPRQRFKVSAAGIVAESLLAGLATLAWNLTANGDLRQAFFFLATTGWLMSLGLNASPFMRFDGYFILSDALDMPNLHERAFALARTALRNVLLGWQDPAPEALPAGRRRALVAFAFLTWLYRLVVFTGIAVAVYVYFFKLLGLCLFAVEIGWFIALPIWRELGFWHARRADITPRRRGLLAVFLLATIVLISVPIGGSIHGAAYAHPARMHTFYSPLPARLVTLPRAAGPVARDAGLFVLEQPELLYKARVAALSSAALAAELRGLGGLQDGEEKRRALERLRDMRGAELDAQRQETARLVLTAPFTGLLADPDPTLAAGVWVSPRQPLAVLFEPGRWQAEVFVDQDSVQHLAPGAVVKFYPDGGELQPWSGTVAAIDSTRLTVLPHEMLSAQHGGRIAVLADGKGMTPRDTLYRVRVDLDRAPAELRLARGRAVVEARPEPWIVSALKPLVTVLIRELSF